MFNINLDNEQFEEFVTNEIDKRMNSVKSTPYMMDTLKACEYLSISRPTFQSLVDKSDIPKYTVGKKILYQRHDIEEMANELCRRAEYKNYDLLEG